MREVEGSSRHRMSAGESPMGEGPVYRLPCPHSPFNKPGLMSVCLSLTYIDVYIFIYSLIDILTLFCLFITREHLGKYNTKFNTRNIDYHG